MEKLDVKQTVIDKAINYVAPTWGANRMRSRYMMAVAGAYIGASRSRKETRDLPSRIGDANADSLQDLPDLRTRSSWHIRNTPIAAGAINTNCYHIVGPGMKLQSRIDRHVLGMGEDEAEEWQDKAEKEWRLFAETHDCDIARKQNIYQQQDAVLRGELERGDVFALRTYKKRKTSPYGTAIQLIEADRVCNDPEISLRNTKNLIAGIEIDDDGEPIKYHVRTTHPGTDIGKFERKWVRIPAYSKSGLWNVTHIYKQLRPGMVRGVPYISGIIEQLYQINKYINGTVAAAVIQSYFTVILQTQTGQQGINPLVSTSAVGKDQKADEDYKLQNAGILEVKNVDEVKFAQPNQPSLTFNAFMQGMFEVLGPALGVPYELLIQHFQKSYSSARTSLLVAWKMFSTKRATLEWQFCNPVYEAQMHEAVLLGRIIAPGFLDNPLMRKAYLGAFWVGPTPGS
ncbi:hypothetical protein LCGC14_2101280, partial [marine sediment metagenome]